MAIFALSCFGIVTFLWVSFGGSTPLAAKKYELKAAFPDAPNLALNADVRIAGVTVGHVERKQLDKAGNATLVTMGIDRQFAPIRRDAQAMLRQKTLLGETFIELAPGSHAAGALKDGSMLPTRQVKPTTDLDQVLQVFDPRTKRFFRAWLQNGARAVAGRSQDINDALGELPDFAGSGSSLLAVLHAHDQALGRLFRNSGAVFQALNARGDELRQLVLNGDRFFSATQRERVALAQAFEIFPTFLDESKSTLARLQGFSVDARPLVDRLRPVASELTPTLRDLKLTAGPLERVFADVPPLDRAAKVGLPAGERFLRGLPPVLGATHAYLPELNPILDYSYLYERPLSQFIGNPGSSTSSLPPLGPGQPRRLYLNQFGIIDQHSLSMNSTRPTWERANAYVGPAGYNRAFYVGGLESFSCAPAGGEKPDPDVADGAIPCLVAPPSLWDHRNFPHVDRGMVPPVKPATDIEGTKPVPILPPVSK